MVAVMPQDPPRDDHVHQPRERAVSCTVCGRSGVWSSHPVCSGCAPANPDVAWCDKCRPVTGA